MRIANCGAVVLIATTALFFSACSVLRASPAQTTPFLPHGEDLKPNPRMPWDAVWSLNPGQVVVKSDTRRKIYVAPVSTQYLNQKPNENGEWTGDPGVSAPDVAAVADLLRQNVIDKFKSSAAANIEVVDQPAPDARTLAMALVELVPTKVGVNVAADVGGILVPGSKALEQAGAIGAQAVSGNFSAGSIAIEAKLVDTQTGTSLAEGKDRETDPASVIPNYRDFEKFGWSRETCRQWAREIVEGFSKDADAKIEGGSAFSILPW